MTSPVKRRAEKAAITAIVLIAARPSLCYGDLLNGICGTLPIPRSYWFIVPRMRYYPHVPCADAIGFCRGMEGKPVSLCPLPCYRWAYSVQCNLLDTNRLQLQPEGVLSNWESLRGFFGDMGDYQKYIGYMTEVSRGGSLRPCFFIFQCFLPYSNYSCFIDDWRLTERRQN